MTAATDNQAARCVSCGKYKAYQQGLCWGCHNAVERFARELHNTEVAPDSEGNKEKTP